MNTANYSQVYAARQQLTRDFLHKVLSAMGELHHIYISPLQYYPYICIYIWISRSRPVISIDEFSATRFPERTKLIAEEKRFKFLHFYILYRIICISDILFRFFYNE